MPLRSFKRINPLDLNKNITIGVAFPLNEDNLFQGTKNIREQIKSNLINLLLTEPGERVNLPNYGVGLKNLLFENNIDTELLKEKILNKTQRYISDISINNVNIFIRR